MKPTYSVILLLFFLHFACSNRGGKGPKPSSLKTDNIENLLGLQLNEVGFRWALRGNGTQSAYQILVASDDQLLAANIGDLWDSGKRYGDRREAVLYKGAPIPAGAKVWWKVRVWNEQDEVGPYSAQASFRAGEAAETANRIVFLGGTLIAGMEKHGYLETELTTRWPKHDLTFRNLGWPGDDVYGTARSEFGSAQNTRSWKPPTAEEGFGNDVMMQQLWDAKPGTLIIGYGAEAAYLTNEAEFDHFVRGYKNLVEAMDSLNARILLLSPHRQQPTGATRADIASHNEWLRKATDMIRSVAEEKGHAFVDLYDKLIAEDTNAALVEGGNQLTHLGYQKMTQVVLSEIGLASASDFDLVLGEDGQFAGSEGVSIDQITRTGKSLRFDVTRDRLRPGAHIQVAGEHLLKIEGEIVRERVTEPEIVVAQDSVQYENLRQTINEKNRLYRYRINPLNKAYIFLFRQHEMGHLAYEMDDFDRLVEEQEELIARLKVPQSRRYEVELLEPWKSPREYPDHEVPRNVPEPNVAEELAAFEVTPGFEINLFAADPMIANPIYMTWDNRGRAWVSTSSTYPHIKPGREPNDKIIILEDTDEDGQADRSIVFAEGLFIPHSVMPVEGGAYVCSTTEFLFLADTDGDDRADQTRVVYSGFGNADVHHTIHGLQWAPWGDLHFTQSIYINTFIETPYGSRRMNGSGVWKFRPETERIEPFAFGRVNPWGFTFDDWGQAFGTDGAGSQQPTYVFPGSAHVSAVGFGRILDGIMSGKPKNTAAEFISGRHMPAKWQGSMLANDFRANRTVRYELQENGSGYSAEEVETVLHSSHRSFRPVDIKMGPEGAVYIVDWYNPIIDHGEVDFHHPLRDKSHGRIWRLTAKNKTFVQRPRIHTASVSELLNHLKAPEQYTRAQANRELVRRKCDPETLRSWLRDLNRSDRRYNHHRLEALWLSAALNQVDLDLASQLLKVNDHRIRAAAVRMLTYSGNTSHAYNLLVPMIDDRHPQVRLEAVNALRSFGTLEAGNLALQALDYPIDADLEFAIWLTARNLRGQWQEALAEGNNPFGENLGRLVFALNAANNKAAMETMAQLLEEGKLSGQDRLDALMMMARLGGEKEVGTAFDIAAKEGLLPVLTALAGAPTTDAAIPSNTDEIHSLLKHNQPAIRMVGARLAGRWKVLTAVDQLSVIVGSDEAANRERLAAANALGDLEAFEVLEELAVRHQDLSIRSVATAAWAGVQPTRAAENAATLLATIEEEASARLLFDAYTRREEGPAILASVLSDKTLSSDIAVIGVRASGITGRDLTVLVDALNKAGSLKPVGGGLSEAERAELLQEVALKGNPGRGSRIYYRPGMLCMTCHKLGNQGGKLGPDISTLGAYMTPESILESLLNPSSAIKQGYETMIVTLRNGDIVTGVLERKTGDGALIRDPNDKLILVPNADIETMDSSPVSLMPAGLTAGLRRDELVDLVAFLTNLGPSQKL